MEDMQEISRPCEQMKESKLSHIIDSCWTE